jgi:toluene monooxygenase system ferredoxin subunit
VAGPRFIPVIERERLARNAKLGLRVAGTRLLLIDLDGEVRAFEDRCPHQGIALSEGRYDEGRLVCRLHEWTFDVATGRCVAWDSVGVPADICLPRFDVTVDRGWICVGLIQSGDG